MSPLRALWGMLDARRRRQFLLLQLLAIAMALSTIGGLAALVPFLAIVTNPAELARYPLLAAIIARLPIEGAQAVALTIGVGFLALVLLSNALNLLGTLAISRFAMYVGDDFHAALLDEYLHRDYAEHLRVGGARYFNRVVFITNRVAHGILESAMLACAHGAAALLVLASIFWVNAWVALIAAAWLGGSYLLLYGAARRQLLRNGEQEARLIEARARIAKDSLGAIRDVQLHGAQAGFGAAFDRTCRAISRITTSSQAIGQGARSAMEAVTLAGLVGATLLLSRGRDVAFWLSQLSFLGFAAYRLMPAVQQVFAAIVRISANRGLFDEVREDLAGAMRSRQRNAASAHGEVIVPRREIRLQDVSFGFAPDAPPVLREVNLAIPAGALAGIVGVNGAGKTTLVDIVLGLLEPRGVLLVDGIRIDAGNRHLWQRSLACVSQSTYLLNATLRENIAFGVAAGRTDPTRLEEAVRRARLEALVASLPRGLDEIIGAGGRELSGGERQRVGIARALYREAPVLVMDGATSALDGFTEQEIVELLRGLRHRRRTILFVAHRLNTLRECDLVLELDAGGVSHVGSYADLVRASPKFRLMTAAYDGATH
jgi:HlyD family secretion protein